MFGVPSKGAKINLDMSIVYSKEITMRTSYAASDLEAQIANHRGRMVRWDTGKSFFWTTTEFHSVSVKIVRFKKVF